MEVELEVKVEVEVEVEVEVDGEIKRNLFSCSNNMVLQMLRMCQ